MTQAVVGALRVNLGLDSAAFTSGISQAQKQMQGFAAKMQSAGASIAQVGAGLTASVTAPLIALGFVAVREASEMRDAMGQVGAAITSMGNVAGRSIDQLKTQADGLAKSSLFEDDQILRGVTANLLTFGNVATANFDRAQQAAVDLATRMNMDLQPATLLIGKALNDPIKGLTAMGRAGIQFTADQKATIKSMVAGGNAAGAQAIILGELERQFGGSALAARNAADPMVRLGLTFKSIAGDVGTILLPTLDKLAKWFEGVAAAFGGLSPQMQQFAVVAGIVAAAIGPVLVVLGAVVASVGAIAEAFAAGGFLAFLLPLLPVIAAVAAAVAVLVGVFLLFRKDIEPVVMAFAKAVQTAMGPPLKAMMAAAGQAFAALGPAISALVAVVGPILSGLAKIMIAVFGPIVVRMLQVLAAGFTGAFAIIGSALKVLTALLTGDWAGAWNAAGSLVMTYVRAIGKVIEAVFPGIGQIVGRMVEQVKGFLGRQLLDVFKRVISGVKTVSDAFFNMYDAVVGHSYVPDMVEGVAEWMAKLDAGMVVPARNATDATREAFESLRDDVAGIFDRLLTDSERATRQLAQDIKKLDAALAKGIISKTQYDQAVGGVAAERMDAPTPLTTLNPMADGRDIASQLRDGAKAAQDRLREAADEFGNRFAESMDRALSGDIKGMFSDMLRDVFQGALKQIGSSLFKSLNLGGSSGKGGGFDLGSMVAAAFKSFKLPGFAQGGSIMPGGSGGIDSQVVAFRKSPTERVDIYNPGSGGSAGGAMSVQVVPSAYFDVRVEKVATAIAGRAGVQSFGAARQQIPADAARHARFNLSGAR